MPEPGPRFKVPTIARSHAASAQGRLRLPEPKESYRHQQPAIQGRNANGSIVLGPCTTAVQDDIGRIGRQHPTQRLRPAEAPTL